MINGVGDISNIYLQRYFVEKISFTPQMINNGIWPTLPGQGHMPVDHSFCVKYD